MWQLAMPPLPSAAVPGLHPALLQDHSWAEDQRFCLLTQKGHLSRVGKRLKALSAHSNRPPLLRDHPWTEDSRPCRLMLSGHLCCRTICAQKTKGLVCPLKRAISHL